MWEFLGKIEGAPDGRFELDGVRFCKDPCTENVWVLNKNKSK